jgi:excinuclease ABC subunit A
VREELGKLRHPRPCPECAGARLRREARHVKIAERTLQEVSAWPLRQTLEFFRTMQLSGARAQVAARIVREVANRLEFLVDVGLEYLTLERSAETLSGGEAQRIRLASQIGSGLTGVMYVLDEPSIGLHQRDNARLIATLKRLRDLGNSVIVVEHDEEAIRAADYVLDMGPGAGEAGGHIVAQGRPEDILASRQSLTGRYLTHELSIPIPTLYGASAEPAPHRGIRGLEHIDKVISVDQSPIGRTPRSNPATYTGLFTPIRDLFAGVPEARTRGYDAGRFSFNVKGGRCEACQGDGVTKVEGPQHPRSARDDRCRGAQLLLGRAAARTQVAHPDECRPGIHPARPVRDHALGRRSAACEALARAFQARHRPHALHPRRADHRAAFP